MSETQIQGVLITKDKCKLIILPNNHQSRIAEINKALDSDGVKIIPAEFAGCSCCAYVDAYVDASVDASVDEKEWENKLFIAAEDTPRDRPVCGNVIVLGLIDNEGCNSSIPVDAAAKLLTVDLT